MTRLLEGLDSGEWTCRGLCEAYLARIEEVDRAGPTLRSIIEVNPNVLELADALDRERSPGDSRGPLHGIPIVLKDNIDTADAMTTTAGSLALQGWIPPEDSGVARKLRDAGAILLAKANLSEWANFRSEHSSSGWSGRGRQCRNPYVLDRNPCGSSSGSGAAVSANLCAAAIGTETDGSIMCPANANGIVGIKPTVGLVSRAGIIPISHTQDTAGPMARSVADAALLLTVLAGEDPRDPATAQAGARAGLDYLSFLDRDALRGTRIGVARNLFARFHPKVVTMMEEALQAMTGLGAELVDSVDPQSGGRWGQEEYEVLLYEFKHDLNLYLSRLPESFPARTLAELIRFNEDHRDEEMPHFDQEIFHKAEEKGGLDSEEYLKALEACRRLSRDEGIDKAMDEHRLDAIVAPTGGPAFKIDLVSGDPGGAGSSGPAAVSGYPNVTVPVGMVKGLPVGISLFGRAWSEGRLVGLAYALEQELRARQAPKFISTLEA